MTRKEQVSNGFTEMMKGFWGNQDLEVPDFEEPCEDAISREKAKQFLYERIDRLNDDELYNTFSVIIDDMYNELPSVTQNLKEVSCEDAVSKQVVLDYIRDNYRRWFINDEAFMQCINGIKDIISVTPQQKVAKWIESKGYDGRDRFYSCSECGRHINLICGARLADYPYCHCGAKMEEVDNC